MRKTLLWMACCALLGCNAELDGLANGSGTSGGSVDPIEPTDPDPLPSDAGLDAGPSDSGTPPPPVEDGGAKPDAGPIQDAAPVPPVEDEDAAEPIPPEPAPDSGMPPPAPAFILTSTTITEGGAFPVDHTCDGKDQSPPLMWTGAPSGTLSYAVVITDLDGANGGGTGGSNTTGGGSTGTGGGSSSGGSGDSSAGTGSSGSSSTGATSGGSSGATNGNGPAGTTGSSSGNGPGDNTGMNGNGPGGNTGMNGNGPGGNTGMNGNSGDSGNSGTSSGGPGGSGPRGFDDEPEFTQAFGGSEEVHATAGFAQWVIWDVAAKNSQLPQNVSRGVLPANVPGAKQVRGLAPLGIAGGGTYAGPCPGRNVTHRYEFKLYALGVALLPGATTTGRPADVVSLIESRGAVVGTATLSASYTGE